MSGRPLERGWVAQVGEDELRLEISELAKALRDQG
jgi:hypothetical protein